MKPRPIVCKPRPAPLPIILIPTFPQFRQFQTQDLEVNIRLPELPTDEPVQLFLTCDPPGIILPLFPIGNNRSVSTFQITAFGLPGAYLITAHASSPAREVTGSVEVQVVP